jgi:hypothetical protein
MSDGQSNVTRRSVLRKSAASATAVGVVGGGAFTSRADAAVTAAPDMDEAAFEAAESRLSESAIHEALETHASDALAEAAGAGVLDTADPGALPLDALHDTPSSWVEATDGATVFAEERDGEPSPKIEVKRQLPDGRLFKLAVRPVEGESQWTVRERAGPGDDSGSGTSSYHICSGCWNDTNCTWVCVGGTCEARWMYCCCDYSCESGDTCDSPVSCDCQDICGTTC